MLDKMYGLPRGIYAIGRARENGTSNSDGRVNVLCATSGHVSCVKLGLGYSVATHDEDWMKPGCDTLSVRALLCVG